MSSSHFMGDSIPDYALEFTWHMTERLLRRMAGSNVYTPEGLLFLRTELRDGGELAAAVFPASVAHLHRALYLDVLDALTAVTNVDYRRLDVRDMLEPIPDDVSSLTGDLGG